MLRQRRRSWLGLGQAVGFELVLASLETAFLVAVGKQIARRVHAYALLEHSSGQCIDLGALSVAQFLHLASRLGGSGRAGAGRPPTPEYQACPSAPATVPGPSAPEHLHDGLLALFSLMTSPFMVVSSLLWW